MTIWSRVSNAQGCTRGLARQMKDPRPWRHRAGRLGIFKKSKKSKNLENSKIQIIQILDEGVQSPGGLETPGAAGLEYLKNSKNLRNFEDLKIPNPRRGGLGKGPGPWGPRDPPGWPAWKI